MGQKTEKCEIRPILEYFLHFLGFFSKRKDSEKVMMSTRCNSNVLADFLFKKKAYIEVFFIKKSHSLA